MISRSDQVPSRTGGVAVAGVIFTLAFLVRLLTLRRGAGLFGMGNYDDGVHYAAAAGVVNGLWPYQDFLFLHPPGVVVLLVPFAVLGEIVRDAWGMAAARLGWIGLGAINAVLVARVLAPLGGLAALIGGLGYVVFFPAIYSERTPLLEAPATTCLLAALVVAGLGERWPNPNRRRLVLAGALLGFSVTIKVWGIVPLLVLFGWLLRRLGGRRAATFLLGAAGACTAVCLPFFLAAPATMWRMVVVDQLGRRPLPVPWAERIWEMVGLSWHPLPGRFAVALVLILVVLIAASALAAADPRGRLPVVLLVFLAALLLSTPSWFLHYSSLLAAPIMLVLGAAGQVAARWVAARAGQAGGLGVGVLMLAGLAAYATPLRSASFGRPFPGPELAASVRALPGCLTSDEPMTLIQTDALTRNLERGCPYVVDLGGASYDRMRPVGEEVGRRRNPVWQAYALSYLRSGNGTILARFQPGQGYSRKTTRVMQTWPVIAQAGRYQVRAPRPE